MGSVCFIEDAHAIQSIPNHLQPSLFALASRVVHSLVAADRIVVCDCPSIDSQVYNADAKMLEPATRGAVFGISTLSIADQSFAHRVDDDVDDTCIFCGNGFFWC